MEVLLTILSVELPAEVLLELNKRHIPDKLVQQFVVQAMKIWLQSDFLFTDELLPEHFSLAQHLQRGLTDVLLQHTTVVRSEDALKSHLDAIFAQN